MRTFCPKARRRDDWVIRRRAIARRDSQDLLPLLPYAEEIDIATGEHLGISPRAFTPLALIAAVSLLIASEPEDDPQSGGYPAGP
jgi:hypothetical protein